GALAGCRSHPSARITDVHDTPALDSGRTFGRGRLPRNSSDHWPWGIQLDTPLARPAIWRAGCGARGPGAWIGLRLDRGRAHRRRGPDRGRRCPVRDVGVPPAGARLRRTPPAAFPWNVASLGGQVLLG